MKSSHWFLIGSMICLFIALVHPSFGTVLAAAIAEFLWYIVDQVERAS